MGKYKDAKWIEISKDREWVNHRRKGTDRVTVSRGYCYGKRCYKVYAKDAGSYWAMVVGQHGSITKKTDALRAAKHYMRTFGTIQRRR